MKILFENTHPLTTPDFVGTDQEKIAVIGYWSGLISQLRSMNMIVISHENKLAIIDQLKKELEMIDIEVNNDTAHPVVHPDGSTEMSQVEVPTEAPGEVVVDLTATESQFNPKISITEMMQRLAGNYYKAPKK
jgi:hypothetical protein